MPTAMSPANAIAIRNYLLREERLIGEELAGRVNFFHTYNHGSNDGKNFDLLAKAESLFASQFTTVPNNVIHDLVMDKGHYSVVGVTKDGVIVAAATYHTFVGQSFTELIFFAVARHVRRMGFGTRIMNYVKKISRDTHGSTHLVIYVNPERVAVRFLIHQGFSKEITQDKTRIEDCMNKCGHDSRGSKLLEFRINPRLHYTNIPYMVRMQLQIMEHQSKLKRMHMSYQVNPTVHPAGNEIIPNLNSIPWLKEARWAPVMWNHVLLKVEDEDLDKLMRVMILDLRLQPNSWPFMLPVDPAIMPDYYEASEDPIDLKTVTERVHLGNHYQSLESFVGDLRRMFGNWRRYRNGKTLYLCLANRMEFHFFQRLCVEVRKAEMIRNGEEDSDEDIYTSSSDEDDYDEEEDDGEVHAEEAREGGMNN